jgi:hypothetical protein
MGPKTIDARGLRVDIAGWDWNLIHVRSQWPAPGVILKELGVNLKPARKRRKLPRDMC